MDHHAHARPSCRSQRSLEASRETPRDPARPRVRLYVRERPGMGGAARRSGRARCRASAASRRWKPIERESEYQSSVHTYIQLSVRGEFQMALRDLASTRYTCNDIRGAFCRARCRHPPGSRRALESCNPHPRSPLVRATQLRVVYIRTYSYCGTFARCAGCPVLAFFLVKTVPI